MPESRRLDDLQAQLERVAYIRHFSEMLTNVQATVTSTVVGDGTTDDSAALQSLVDEGDGAIVLPQGKRIYLAQPVRVRNNVVLDLNGSKLIAPKGAIVASSGLGETLYGAPLFEAEEGERTFRLGEDVGIETGELLMLRSDETRIAFGDYRHGQYACVTSVSDRSISLDKPFYASYPVTELYRLRPLVVAIQNGTIDMRSAVPNEAGQTPFRGVEMRGKHCFCHNLRVLGGNEAGAGLHAEGMNVVFSDCYAEGFVNLSGIIGKTGRFGYGFSMDGDSVIAESCSAVDCKHGFTSGSRRITTRLMTIKNCFAQTPADAFHQMTAPGGAKQPVYQAMIDAHANVLDFNVLGCETTGCNSAIAVRGGRATIENPKITTFGNTLKYRNDFLISIYEAPVSAVVVRNARVDGSAIADTSEVPALVGIQPLNPGQHGKIEIEQPTVTNVRLFELPGQAKTSIASEISLQCLSITGATGTIVSGVRVGKAAKARKFGEIGEITVSGRLDVSDWNEERGFLVDVDFVAALDRLIIQGAFDGTGANAPIFIRVGAQDTDMIPPQLVDLRNTRLVAAHRAFSLSTRSKVRAGRGVFTDADIRHSAAPVCLNSDAGLSVILPIVAEVPWAFEGTRIHPDTQNPNCRANTVFEGVSIST